MQLVDDRAFARREELLPLDKGIQTPLFCPLNTSQEGSTLT